MKIALIDFDDSFTANISEVLFKIGHQVNTFHWKDFKNQHLISRYDAIVLGPGPGFVDDYRDIFSDLEELREFPILGICLGHQILLSLEGYRCSVMPSPVHGKSLPFPRSASFLNFPNLDCQLYNSWAVQELDLPGSKVNKDMKLVCDNEILAIYHHRHWIGCQFHPESVGTSYPHEVLERLLEKICIMT